jgi:hypothetical protein
MVGTSGLGIIFVIIGFETYLRNQSQFFSDWLTVPIFLVGMLGGQLIQWVVECFGEIFLVYNLVRRTSNAREARNKMRIPAWLRLAELKNMFGGQEIATETQTARIIDDAFRARFLKTDGNKEWIVANIPKLLTPRVALTMGSKIMASLGEAIVKIKSSVSANYRSISSEDEEETGMEESNSKYAKHDFTKWTQAATNILKFWIGLVRRRKLLDQWLIEFTGNVSLEECSMCGTTKNLTVNYKVPLMELLDNYEVKIGPTAVPTRLRFQVQHLSL